jgi:acetate kinase
MSAVLTLNAGSSSIKLAVYEKGPPLTRSMSANLSGIGTNATRLSWTGTGRDSGESAASFADIRTATKFVLDWLEQRGILDTVDGVGHRVVHGLERTKPARITPEVLAELQAAVPYAPNHLPLELTLIDALITSHPRLPQVACFDTAFHSNLPQVARVLPLPRRYYAKGIKRYGFHGLSCAYLVEELARVAGERAANARLLLAHLGNGASITAVKHGRSVETSMGFTPAAGLVMSTRTGDLDPGIVSYLARTEQMTAEAFDRMVNQESGLLGVSGITSDMRELLSREGSDAAAALAITLFCYQARKWVGALTAVLGGLDTLVFSAGVGERSAVIRKRICEGLEFLGIALDDGRNQDHAAIISKPSSPVTVRIIPTDEEVMIARSVLRELDVNADKEERDA